MKIITFTLACLAIFYTSFAKEHVERKINIEKTYNIECSNSSKSYQLFHVTATNTHMKNDVMHYLWTAINRPTIVIKHTMVLTTLTVNENNICNGAGESFEFSSGNNEISGLIINSILPYIDENDDAELSDGEKILDDVIGSFTWKNGTFNVDDASFVADSKDMNGTLMFELKAHNATGHSKPWPHHPVNANITEFTLTMKDLPAKNKKTRYAVEVLFFSSDKSSNNGKFDTAAYIDDEFTPGVFDIWSVKFLEGSKQMFSSWKPVAYITPKRSREEQTLSHNYYGSDKLMSKSGVLNVYIDKPTWTIVGGLKDPEFYRMRLTYGLSKDGFYGNYNYLSWVGMVGSGIPPKDAMSDTAIIIIIVGVGAPAVVILIAILYLLIRKVRLSRRSGYNQIN